MNTQNETLRDHGPEPYAFNIDRLTKLNDNYRTALWTGENLQLTLMSIPVGGEIGLEIHTDTDQFIRVESGLALAEMGAEKDALTLRQRLDDRYTIMVPAGTWHNVTNIGTEPLKVYTLYAPPHHPHGTIQKTKAEADAAEH